MIIKTTIAAALLGLSMNAFAATSDLSSVTHGDKAGQALNVGQITEPRWSDRASLDMRAAAKPFAKSAGNYRFGDISSVTHN